MAGKGTAKAVYILRTVMEHSTDLHLCFIDYTKASDTVKHQEIMEELEDINIDGKDVRIIKNKYWKQTAAVGVDNQIGIKRCQTRLCIIA